MNEHLKHNFYCVFKCMYLICTVVLFLFWPTQLSSYSWHSSSPRPCMAKLWWRRLATMYLVPCGLSPGVRIISLFPVLLWVAVCSLSLIVKGTMYWSAQAIENQSVDIPAHMARSWLGYGHYSSRRSQWSDINHWWQWYVFTPYSRGMRSEDTTNESWKDVRSAGRDVWLQIREDKSGL